MTTKNAEDLRPGDGIYWTHAYTKERHGSRVTVVTITTGSVTVDLEDKTRHRFSRHEDVEVYR